MNSGQGLGVCFRKKRIEPEFVSGLLWKTAAWMLMVTVALKALVSGVPISLQDPDTLWLARLSAGVLLAVVVFVTVHIIGSPKVRPIVQNLPLEELEQRLGIDAAAKRRATLLIRNRASQGAL